MFILILCTIIILCTVEIIKELKRIRNAIHAVNNKTVEMKRTEIE